MTAKEAIQTIKVMLGVDQAVETTDTIELAKATLVDGTEVEVEGAFEVGKVLNVLTAEGPVAAPEGKHETSEGIVITVDANGVITEIMEKEEEVEVEQTEATLSEDFVKQIVSAIDNKFNELNSKLEALNHEFSAFKDEPAGKRITNNLNETQKVEGDLTEARFNKLVEFRKQTLK